MLAKGCSFSTSNCKSVCWMYWKLQNVIAEELDGFQQKSLFLLNVAEKGRYSYVQCIVHALS